MSPAIDTQRVRYDEGGQDGRLLHRAGLHRHPGETPTRAVTALSAYIFRPLSLVEVWYFFPPTPELVPLLEQFFHCPLVRYTGKVWRIENVPTLCTPF